MKLWAIHPWNIWHKYSWWWGGYQPRRYINCKSALCKRYNRTDAWMQRKLNKRRRKNKPWIWCLSRSMLRPRTRNIMWIGSSRDWFYPMIGFWRVHRKQSSWWHRKLNSFCTQSINIGRRYRTSGNNSSLPLPWRWRRKGSKKHQGR